MWGLFETSSTISSLAWDLEELRELSYSVHARQARHRRLEEARLLSAANLQTGWGSTGLLGTDAPHSTSQAASTDSVLVPDAATVISSLPARDHDRLYWEMVHDRRYSDASNDSDISVMPRRNRVKFASVVSVATFVKSAFSKPGTSVQRTQGSRSQTR